MVLTRFHIALALFTAALVVQPGVASDPVLHMLVQFPLLGAAGYMLGGGIRIGDTWTGAVLIGAIAVLLFWMLPRSLDAAVTSWPMLFAKFVTLPLGVGLPLGLVWRQLNPILRGFLKAETISMLGVLGFLYTHAPVRICNSYLVDDQIRLGYGFFYLAVALATCWSVPVLFGQSSSSNIPLPGKIEHDIR